MLKLKINGVIIKEEIFINKLEEKRILVQTLGILYSLKYRLITIDESEQLLFRPGVTIMLKNKGCNRKVINLLEYCCEIEDIESILPNIYDEKLNEFIEKTIKDLKLYYLNAENKSSDTVEISKFSINKVDKILEKEMLIEILGILYGTKYRLVAIQEYIKYLFSFEIIDKLKNEKCANVVIEIIEECFEVSNLVIKGDEEKYNSEVDKLIKKTINNLKSYSEFII